MLEWRPLIQNLSLAAKTFNRNMKYCKFFNIYRISEFPMIISDRAPMNIYTSNLHAKLSFKITNLSFPHCKTHDKLYIFIDRIQAGTFLKNLKLIYLSCFHKNSTKSFTLTTNLWNMCLILKHICSWNSVLKHAQILVNNNKIKVYKAIIAVWLCICYAGYKLQAKFKTKLVAIYKQ